MGSWYLRGDIEFDYTLGVRKIIQVTNFWKYRNLGVKL